jgi:hypothetical protein
MIEECPQKFLKRCVCFRTKNDFSSLWKIWLAWAGAATKCLTLTRSKNAACCSGTIVIVQYFFVIRQYSMYMAVDSVPKQYSWRIAYSHTVDPVLQQYKIKVPVWITINAGWLNTWRANWDKQKHSETTSLEYKLPVFGKSHGSAKFFLWEIWVDYVQNVCKKIVYCCLNIPQIWPTLFFQRSNSIYPRFPISKPYWNTGICQSLRFSSLKMSLQDIFFLDSYKMCEQGCHSHTMAMFADVFGMANVLWECVNIFQWNSKPNWHRQKQFCLPWGSKRRLLNF